MVSDNKGRILLQVSESRVLRRIFGSRSDEIIRGWIKLRNEEHHNLYPSPTVIIMIKSRGTREAEHVASMNEEMNACSVFGVKTKRKGTTGKT